jgi:hypothetical protein
VGYRDLDTGLIYRKKRNNQRILGIFAGVGLLDPYVGGSKRSRRGCFVALGGAKTIGPRNIVCGGRVALLCDGLNSITATFPCSLLTAWGVRGLSIRIWTHHGSWPNGMKLSSNTLLYQCFACLSARSESPQASWGQRVTAWDSIFFDRAARKPTPRRPPLMLDKKRAFDYLNAIRTRAINCSHPYRRFVDTLYRLFLRLGFWCHNILIELLNRPGKVFRLEVRDHRVHARCELLEVSE